MKWLLYGFVGLVVLLIAGLFAVPKVMDWNQYRPQIAGKLKEATGLDVRITGPITATLLPSPRLIMTNIEILDPSLDEPRATIRWIGADASLPALFQGNVRVTGVTIVEPEVNATQFRIPENDVDAGTGDGSATPSSGTAGPDAVPPYQLEGEIRVEQGSILWPGGERSTGITGAISVSGQATRWSGDLTVTHRASPFIVGLRIASDGREDGARFQATITPAEAKAKMELNGRLLSSSSAGLSFDGTVVASIEEPSATIEPWLPQLASLLASTGEIRLESQAKVSGDAIDLQSIRFESSGGSGSGNISIDPGDGGHADVKLQFNRLDMDALRRQPASSESAADASGTGSDQLPVPDTSGENTVTSLMQLFRASGMDATVDISAAAIRLKGSLIRNAVIRTSIEDGSITLEEAAALLPGGSSVSLAGYGSIGEKTTTFEGNVSVQADDLRRLMKWGGLRVPRIAADRFRSLDFVSGLKYVDNRLDLVDATVVIDGVKAEVSAAVALRARPGIGLRIAIERLNLDAYRVLDNEASAESADGEGSGLILEGNAAADSDNEEGAAPAFDAIVNLTVQQLILGGVPVKGLTGQMVYRDGQLRSDALTFVDAGGLAGSAMGEFDATTPDWKGTATVRGHGEDLGGLAAILGASDTIATRIRQFGESDVLIVYEREQAVQRLGFQIDGRDGSVSADTSWQPLGNSHEVTVTNGTLKAGVVNAEAIEFQAVTQGEDTIRFVGLSGTLNGGAFSGDMKTSKTPIGWTGQGKARVADIPVEAVLDGLQGSVRTQGRVSVDADIAFDESRSLSGNSSLLIDGSISGTATVGVPSDSEAVVKIARIERLRQVLNRSFSGVPNAVQGTFTAGDRSFSTSGITIAGSDDATMTLKGQADFSSQSVTAEVLVEDGDTEDYRLTVSGPLDRPSLRLSN